MKSINYKNILPVSFVILSFLFVLNNAIAQIKSETDDIKELGIDLDDKTDWPTNFWLSAKFYFINEEGDIENRYYNNTTGYEFNKICPWTVTHQEVSEHHDGLYTEGRTLKSIWRLKKDGAVVYQSPVIYEEVDWQGQSEFIHFYQDYLISEEGRYWWEAEISMSRALWGYKTLLEWGDGITGDPLIYIYENHEDYDEVFQSYISFDLLAMHSVTLSPGFEYAPSGNREMLVDLVDCGGKKQSSEFSNDFNNQDNQFKSSSSISGTIKNENSDISIFPNPNKDGKFTVTSKCEEFATVEVYSQLGQLVLGNLGKFRNGGLRVDLSEHGSGFYFVKIIFEDGNTIIKKVIVAD
jgi:hypothetical protein